MPPAGATRQSRGRIHIAGREDTAATVLRSRRILRSFQRARPGALQIIFTQEAPADCVDKIG